MIGYLISPSITGTLNVPNLRISDPVTVELHPKCEGDVQIHFGTNLLSSSWITNHNQQKHTLHYPADLLFLNTTGSMLYVNNKMNNPLLK